MGSPKIKYHHRRRDLAHHRATLSRYKIEAMLCDLERRSAKGLIRRLKQLRSELLLDGTLTTDVDHLISIDLNRVSDRLFFFGKVKHEYITRCVWTQDTINIRVDEIIQAVLDEGSTHHFTPEEDMRFRWIDAVICKGLDAGIKIIHAPTGTPCPAGMGGISVRTGVPVCQELGADADTPLPNHPRPAQRNNTPAAG